MHWLSQEEAEKALAAKQKAERAAKKKKNKAASEDEDEEEGPSTLQGKLADFVSTLLEHPVLDQLKPVRSIHPPSFANWPPLGCE